MSDEKDSKKPSYQDKIKEIMRQIECGVQRLFQSGKLDQYLRIMSKFHHYSLNNTILIFLQRPDATYCAGYRAWQNEFGRHVKKGEKSIKILAPSSFKKTVQRKKLDPRTQLPLRDTSGNVVMERQTVTVPSFRTVDIFDIAQTDGPPLPQLAEDLTADVEHFDIFMEAVRKSSPVPIEIKPLREDLDGLFSRDAQSITIREGMGQLQTLCSTLHEVTHSVVDNGPEAVSRSKAEKEITAESVAMAVCAYYGLDTSANSIPYLGSYCRDKTLPELKACLQTILETANNLIADIDRNYAETCRERGIPIPIQMQESSGKPDRVSEQETAKESGKRYGLESVTEPARDAYPEPKQNTTTGAIYPMPDVSLPADALQAAGYAGNDLLPLSADRACELIDRDMSVYVVQRGENPMMAFDREEIMDCPAGTVFAVPRTEWEASAEYQQAMAAMENPGASQEMIPKRRTYNRTGKGRTTKKTKPERGR